MTMTMMENTSHFEPTAVIETAKYAEDRQGQFVAHINTGVYWALLGIVGLTATLHRYHSCQKTKTPFRAATVTWSVKIGHLTLYPESISRVFVSSGLSLYWVVIYTFSYGVGEIFVMDAQHMSILVTQCLAAGVELLSAHGHLAAPELDYMANVVAYFYMFFSFSNHEHQRLPVDTHFHVWFTLVPLLVAGAYVVEQLYRRSLVASLVRSVAVMMIGLWSSVIAFSVFGQPTTTWDLADLGNVSRVNMAIGLTTLASVLLTFLIDHRMRTKVLITAD